MSAGTLTSIVHQPLDRSYAADDRLDDFIRVPVDAIEVVADFGLAGDQKARKGSVRQVNILSAEWLESLAALGYRTKPGEMGEQLIVAGLRVEELLPGDQFRIGADVVLEITKPRTGCSRLEHSQGKPLREFQPAIGMLSRVIAGGTIHVGDAVRAVPRGAESSTATSSDPVPAATGYRLIDDEDGTI
ncbi:MAG: MOSC domain-containing protein [Candidatus Eisenbacteria bacterium]|nr:MOSC domain-containing protein [Candidatus Eisenbacteria bacterium]